MGKYDLELVELVACNILRMQICSHSYCFRFRLVGSAYIVNYTECYLNKEAFHSCLII